MAKDKEPSLVDRAILLSSRKRTIALQFSDDDLLDLAFSYAHGVIRKGSIGAVVGISPQNIDAYYGRLLIRAIQNGQLKRAVPHKEQGNGQG
jgi:hypothetical protein